MRIRNSEPKWYAECQRLRDSDKSWTHAALAAYFKKGTGSIRRCLNKRVREHGVIYSRNYLRRKQLLQILEQSMNVIYGEEGEENG